MTEQPMNPTYSPDPHSEQESATSEPVNSEVQTPSYTKLAMRNMVRKSGKSLQHFFLSTIGLLALFIGLSYLTH